MSARTKCQISFKDENAIIDVINVSQIDKSGVKEMVDI